MSRILKLDALEILDSRGSPTIETTCLLQSGVSACASVPSGASTGAAEAHELRDGDGARYAGRGCRGAVRAVENEIQGALVGRELQSTKELDDLLSDCEGTRDRSRLGANALLSVSLAFTRATAVERGVPLWRAFHEMLDPVSGLEFLPRPTINLFSGGLHAGGQVAIQDVLIVPATADTIAECLEVAASVHREAAGLLCERFGARLLTADEGGLAPLCASSEAMIELAVEAIERAGLVAGRDVSLALDVASPHFHEAGAEIYRLDEESLGASAMVERLADWVDRFGIVSLEDGLAEDAWDDWPRLHARLAGSCLTVGDDLLCTNPERIRRAISSAAADALLLKVNQIGTLSEAAEALRLARSAAWNITVSARSGETEDDWLADLAFGWQGEQIKVGSVTQSERLAKYNRLLRIEKDTGLSPARWPR